MSRQANRRSRWECGIEERSDEVGSSRPAGPGICGSKYGKAERPQGFWGQSPHRRTLGAEPLTEWRKLRAAKRLSARTERKKTAWKGGL